LVEDFLWSLSARSRAALIAGIARADQLISGVLAGDWFAGCGYLVNQSENHCKAGSGA
jgi:hypothetical protein